MAHMMTTDQKYTDLTEANAVVNKLRVVILHLEGQIKDLKKVNAHLQKDLVTVTAESVKWREAWEIDAKENQNYSEENKDLKENLLKVKEENEDLKNKLLNVKDTGRPGITKNVGVGDFIPGFPTLRLTRLQSRIVDPKTKKIKVLSEQAFCTLCKTTVVRTTDKQSHPCARKYKCNGKDTDCTLFNNPSMDKMKRHVVEKHTDKLENMNIQTALKVFANMKNPDFIKIKDEWIVEKRNPKFFG